MKHLKLKIQLYLYKTLLKIFTFFSGLFKSLKIKRLKIDWLKCFKIKNLRFDLKLKIKNLKLIPIAAFVGVFIVLSFLVLFLIRRPKPTFNPYLTKAFPDSNFLYQNTKNPFKVYLGNRQDEKKPTARFEVGQNKFVEFEAENLQASRTDLEGSKTLRYRDIRDQYDITYKIIEKGLKEEIILKKHPPRHPEPDPPTGGEGKGSSDSVNAASGLDSSASPQNDNNILLSPVSDEEKISNTQFSFLLSYPKEMEIKERLPNELAFYEKDGPYLFHFQKPFMEDAKKQRSEEIKIQVRRVNPAVIGSVPEGTDPLQGPLQYRLTFVPDQSWLADPNRKYPVVLDPTIIHDTPSEFSSGSFNRTTDSGSGQTSKLETSFEELPADINTVGLWHMNETSGSSVADSSGNSNTGTATGTTIVDGKLNKTRSFDGSNDYVDVGTGSSLNLGNTFTVSAWIKPTTLVNYGGIVSKVVSNRGGTYSFMLVCHGDGTIGAYDTTIPSWQFSSNAGITAGNWYHVAWVLSGGYIYYYVNGQSYGSDPFSYTDTDAHNVFFGSWYSPTTTYDFNGIIDEVRVSNVALSPEEIKSHANRRPYGVYTSPVIDFGQTPASLNALNWVDNITPPSFPSGWTKVKPVLIDNTQNSSALTNYQVKVHVDYDSNMQSDFDDLKFTNSSGTNLDYWIESKSDGVEATVWVEVDTIAASSWQTIFMFYGNSGASAASNGTNTFVFFDDFNDGSLNTSIWNSAGTVSESGGIVTLTNSGSTIYSKTNYGVNYSLRYRGNHPNVESNWVGFINAANTPFAIFERYPTSQWNARSYVSAETITALSTSLLGTYQTYEVARNNGTSNLYWVNNGTSGSGLHTTQVTSSSLPLTVYMLGTGSISVDWFALRQYTAIEPTVSVGASVEFETHTSADNSTWEEWRPTTNETAIASMDSDSSNWSSLPAADFTQSWKKYDNSIPARSDTTSTNGRVPRGTDTKGDDDAAYEPTVLLDDSTYKIWYAGSDGTNVRLYYATSPDGLTWTKLNNVTATNCDSGSACEGNGKLGLGSSGRGDDFHTYKASVIKDGSTYKMWYSGYAGADDPYWRIYYATSPDGLTWTKYDNTVPANSNTTGTNGRIPRGASGGDANGAIAPMVIKDGSTYKMWYEGTDGSNVDRIYYATSPDGLTWTKYDNTIPTTPSDTTGTNGRLPLGTNGAADDTHTQRPAVIQDGSLYKMWYTAHDGTNVRIAYAYSTDGLTWTKYDNSIPPASDGSSTNGRVPLGTGSTGDNSHSHAPTVVKSGNTYKMWYMGYNANWLIYHATMDLMTLPTAKADDSTIKMEGTGSMKTTIGAPQVDSDMRGLWHLEETSGNANNSTSLSGLTLTASNSPGSTDGFFSKGRSFTAASSQNFSCTDASCGGTDKLDPNPSSSTGWSFGAWVYANSFPGTAPVIMGKYGTGSDLSYTLMINTSGQIRAEMGNSACNNDSGFGYQSTTVPLKQWTHLIITASGNPGVLKIYKNGSLFYTSPQSAYYCNTAGNFYLGTNGVAGYYWDGKIDEPFVSAKTMTSEEVAELYRAGRDHRLEKTLSSTDLSAKNKIPFYVASDRPGTNLEAYIGETTNSVYGADANTVGLWHLEEKSESWGDTFPGTTIDTTKWVEIDPNANKISQSTGLVLSAGTVAAWDSGVISQANFTRQTANRLYARFTTGSSVAAPNHMMVGWGQDQTAGASYTYITHALYFSAGTFYVYQDGALYGGPYGSGYTTSTTYEVLITLASNGTAKYEVKGGAYTSWTTLLAADNPKTNTPLRAQVAQYQHTGTFNEIRVYPSVFVKDSSTSANNGTTYGTTLTQGKIGKGRYFNGSSDYISIPHSSSLNLSGSFTLSAWVKLNVGGAQRQIVAKSDDNASPAKYALFIKDTNKPALQTHNGTFHELAANTALSTDQWYHVAGTFDGTNMRVYVNGVLDSTPTAGAYNTNTEPVTIGGFTDAQRMNGLIDEVRVSNTARSATEIQQTYQYGLRTHPITTDFVTNPQATYASGTSITINNPWGTTNLTDTLSVGDTIIIRQNENGTEYISQSTVSAIANTSSTYGTVTLAAAFSSIPPSGYTTNAKVFKWQREYWDLKDISEADRNAITKLGIRVLDGSQGFTFWLDDFRSNSNYLYLPFGNTITSTANRYFQYRAIITGTDGPPSSSNTQNTPTPQISRVTVNYTLSSSGDEKDGRPVTQWKFDEGYGTTAYDETINNHDGTLQSMESTDWVTGYQGKALNLGGTDEYLSVANSADVNFGDHSMSISAFVNTTSSGGTYPIIDKYNSGMMIPSGYKLEINSTGKVVFTIGDGTNTPSVTSNKSVNDGKWHSILAIRTKGSTLKIYIDGVYDNQVSDTADNIDSTTDVLIDRDLMGSNYFIGKLDELELYDYALSASQAKVVYNKGYSAVLGATEDVNKGGAGPVGYWKLDEATGTSANDSSGNGNTGTLTLGPTWITSGKIGSAINFDGSDDFVSVGDNSSLKITGAITISAWVKTTDTLGGITTKIEQANPYDGYSLKIGRHTGDASYNGKATFFLNSGSGDYGVGSVNTVNDDNWHYLTGVFIPGSKLQIYVDGVLSNETNVSITTIDDTTRPFDIGREYPSGTNAGYLSGQIDHVKVYNYSRSVAQIHADMAGSPVAYWKFNEGYGITAYDESTNNNDGTLTSFPTSGAWVAGRFGRALNFDSTDDYITVPAANSINLYSKTSYTISVWINPDSDGEGDTGNFFRKGNSYLRVDTESGGTVEVSALIDLATDDATINTTETIPINQWSYIVAVWEDDVDDEVSIYINGHLSATSIDGNGSTADDSASTLNIGGNAGATTFDGKIDEVKIYNYALTPDEIKVEYNQSSAVSLGNTLDVNASGSNPVGFWKMDEASGQYANDSSGTNNQGTLGADSGSGSDDPTWTTAGKIGSGLYFDGTDDYVNIPDNDTLDFGTGNFTVGGWIKGEFTTDTCLVSKFNSSTVGYRLCGENFGYLFFYTNGQYVTNQSGYGSTIYNGNTIDDNSWHYIVGVRDSATTLKIYIDGSIAATKTVTSQDVTNADPLNIDRNYGITPNRYGQANMDHVKVYNYARSQKQVAMDYNGGKPVAHWKLDEASGITAYDESDNNNDGTLTNMEDADHVNGKIGRALEFDGGASSEYVNFGTPSTLSLSGKSFTIEHWIKTSYSAANQSIYHKYSTGGSPNDFWGDLINTDGKFSFQMRDSALVRYYLTGNTVVTDGNWHHLVITWDENTGTGKMYIDGVNDNPTIVNDGNPGDIDNTSNVYLGGLCWGYFNGQIDDVHIYNYTHSADEVKLDYNNGVVNFK